MPGRCLRDALDVLQREGFANATATRVHHAIIVGHVKRPSKDGSGRFRFRKRDLDALRTYLANVPRPGRKPKGEDCLATPAES